MRPKSDFKHLMLTLALSVMLAVFGFMAMSGAWFFDTEQDTATITLKNGIQLQTTGLTETDGVYTLKFNNSTELAPGQTITAENVTV